MKHWLKKQSVLARTELAFLWRQFLRAFLWVAMVAFVSIVAAEVSWFVLSEPFDAWKEQPGTGAEMDWLGFCVGLMGTNLTVSLNAAFYGALIWLAWLMFGPWSVVPLALTPLAIIASFWVFSDVVLFGVGLLFHAVEVRAAEINFAQFDVGAAARTPLGAVLGLMFFLFGAGMVLWDLGVVLALVLLLLILGAVVAAGAVPALLFSGLALTRAYVVRVRRRHL